MMMTPPPSLHHAQGAALIVALLMLMVILMLGISATNIALQSGQVARYQNDRIIAFEAAEAALMDAQKDLEGARKQHVFPVRSNTKPSASCTVSGDYLGLCIPALPGQPPVWENVQAMYDAPSVAYGQFTGSVFAHGSGTLPAKAPRYIIESMQAESSLNNPLALYRITSIGFGARASTQVVLQVFYRKQGQTAETNNQVIGQYSKQPTLDLNVTTSESAAVAPATQPAQRTGRLSWREITYWQDIIHRTQP